MLVEVREDNPGEVLVFVVGALCGSAFTFFAAGGGPKQPLEDFELERTDGAIVLFHPGSPAGLGVDMITGQDGYSHCALYLGHADTDGTPLLVDTYPVKGVHLHRADDYGEGEYVIIPLPTEDAAYARRKANHLLRTGAGYRGRPNGVCCSELVLECLPETYAGRFQGVGFATPNDIARAFGLSVHQVSAKTVKKLRQKLLR